MQSLLEIIEALMGQQSQVPQVPGSVRELPDEERRRVNRQGMLTLASIIGGAPPGMLGSGLAQGMAAREDVRQQELERYIMQQRQGQQDERQRLSSLAELAGVRDQEMQRRAESEQAAQLRERALSQLAPDDPRRSAIEAASPGQLFQMLEGIARERQAPTEEEKLAALRRELELREQVRDQYQDPPAPDKPSPFQAPGSGRFIFNPNTGEMQPNPLWQEEEGSRDPVREAAVQLLTQQTGVTPSPEEVDQMVALMSGRQAEPPPPDPSSPAVAGMSGFQEAAAQRFGLGGQQRIAPPKPPPPPDPTRPQMTTGTPTGSVTPKSQRPTDKPEPTVDDVLRKLPKGFQLPPEATAQIQQDLQAGVPISDIVREILADAQMFF